MFWSFLASVILNPIYTSPTPQFETKTGVSVWHLTPFEHEKIYDTERVAVPVTTLWTVIGLAGVVGSFVCILATFLEFTFIPFTSRNTRILLRRASIYTVIMVVCLAPAVHLFFINGDTGVAQLVTGVGCVLNAAGLAVVVVLPPAVLGGSVDNETFVGNVAVVTKSQRLYSIALWCLLFLAKFIESVSESTFFFFVRVRSVLIDFLG